MTRKIKAALLLAVAALLMVVGTVSADGFRQLPNLKVLGTFSPYEGISAWQTGPEVGEVVFEQSPAHLVVVVYYGQDGKPWLLAYLSQPEAAKTIKVLVRGVVFTDMNHEMVKAQAAALCKDCKVYNPEKVASEDGRTFDSDVKDGGVHKAFLEKYGGDRAAQVGWLVEDTWVQAHLEREREIALVQEAISRLEAKKVADAEVTKKPVAEQPAAKALTAWPASAADAAKAFGVSGQRSANADSWEGCPNEANCWHLKDGNPTKVNVPQGAWLEGWDGRARIDRTNGPKEVPAVAGATVRPA